jgi:hypothetical protein
LRALCAISSLALSVYQLPGLRPSEVLFSARAARARSIPYSTPDFAAIFALPTLSIAPVSVRQYATADVQSNSLIVDA